MSVPAAYKPRFEELPDIMTVDEVATWLGVGRATLYELIRVGRFPHLRFGRTIRVPKKGLERYLLGEFPGQGGEAA